MRGPLTTHRSLAVVLHQCTSVPASAMHNAVLAVDCKETYHEGTGPAYQEVQACCSSSPLSLALGSHACPKAYLDVVRSLCGYLVFSSKVPDSLFFGHIISYASSHQFISQLLFLCMLFPNLSCQWPPPAGYAKCTRQCLKGSWKLLVVLLDTLTTSFHFPSSLLKCRK